MGDGDGKCAVCATPSANKKISKAYVLLFSVFEEKGRGGRKKENEQ